MSAFVVGLQDQTIVRSETLVIPLHLQRKATDATTYSDVAISGVTLSMVQTAPDGTITLHDWATYGTVDSGAKGYWKWTEAQIETEANWANGAHTLEMWVEDAGEVAVKRKVGRCTITITEDSGKGLV